MLWLLAALSNSLLGAANVEINRQARQEGYRLNMWRTALAALFWFPLAMIQPWPEDAAFYEAAALSGLSVIIGNVIQNRLALRHNGRIAIIHMPLKALVVFVGWILMDSAYRGHLFDRPMWTLVALCSLGVMGLAVDSMRKNDASWAALRTVAPLVVLYAVSDLFARQSLPMYDLAARLPVFLFLMTGVSASVSFLLWPWRPEAHLPGHSHKLVRAGGWAALMSIANHMFFFLALSMAPNPAYVSIVALLTPVWLLIYHRVRGIPDDASPVAGTILVLGAIMLMVATSQH